jgi:putative endonuclease
VAAERRSGRRPGWRPGRLGRSGELIALAFLMLKGYRLRHRNWRGPSGELDLVVERRGEIVFVEVKTRSSELLGGAGAAFDTAKKAAVARTAAAYLSRFGLWERPCRFDLVAIERIARLPGWRIRHIVGAFAPDQGRVLA